MPKKNSENGASTSKRSGRAHRSSAIKAKAFIKNALDVNSDEQVDGEESNEDMDANDAEVYYSLSSSSADEMDIGPNINEKTRKSSDRLASKPSSHKKLTAVQVERYKRELFKHWSDFIVSPKSNLRKTSEMNFKWTNSSDNHKIAVCPNTGCHQKFTTRQGLTYHFQRCGVLIQWGCKLCNYIAEAQKTLILHHLLDNHKDQLPPTEPHLMSCLSDNRKATIKSKKRRSLIETESSAVEFYQQYCEKPTLLNFLPRSDIWIPLSEIEYSMCIPEVTISPKFKISSNSSSNDSEWHRLNLFESISKEDTFTCFVGGCIWAASWCPLPLSETDNQYIAVASCRNNDSVHSMNHLESENGLIQLWNFGELNRQTSPNHEPNFCLGIAHSYGVIWDMEWCPGGTSWQRSSTDNGNNHLPRLGLLSLACGDGILRILSVPQPSSLSSTTKIYRCEPIVILDPPGTGPAFANQSTICRSVSWQKTDEQRLIAAGFGSGVVAVWDLTTVSPILVIHKTSSQTILRPKESWIAHGAQVNDLKWLPYSKQNLIVTASFDRTLKVWNLNDLITPIFVMPRKSIFTRVDWNFKWCGVFAAFDESYSNWQASNYVIFKDAGFLDWPPNTLTPHRACVWDFAISDWMNTEVSVDAAGEAVIYTNFAVKHDSKSSRKQVDRLPLYRMELADLSNQSTAKKGKARGNYKKGTICVNWTIDREKPLQRSYTEMVENYGIIFRDFCNGGRIPENELKRVRIANDMQYQRLSDYPLISLTVVDWNPNINSFNWILTAGQSGFLRVVRYNAN